jgi:putative SOS response-associated peptidase YedK
MCGRFNLTASGEEVAEAFELDEVPQLSPRYNIAPTQPVAVVRLDAAVRRRRLAPLVWGFVPEGAPETDRGLINARAETAWQKPTFRDAFAKRRCLLPANGFYEWKRQGGRRPQPWLFTLGAGNLFALAGLWEPPAREGAQPTCTILTTDPNDVTRAVHDRMPVILPPGDWKAWLDVEVHDAMALRALLRRYPADAMRSRAVSTAINSPRNDGPECLEPPPEGAPPRQGSLF